MLCAHSVVDVVGIFESDGVIVCIVTCSFDECGDAACGELPDGSSQNSLGTEMQMTMPANFHVS